VIANKYFKIKKNYFCRLEGHLKFHKDIFLETRDKISKKNMKNAQESIELVLRSIDKNCPFSIKASLKYKENRIGLLTLLFCIFIIILGGFIIRGGYKMIKNFNENFSIANRYSLVSLQIAVTFDFAFMIHFLVTGNF
jgi:hypothetical protein